MKALKREEVLRQLQPYWDAVEQPKGGLIKALETYVYVVSRGGECWTYLTRHSDELCRESVCDELARVYLRARDAAAASGADPSRTGVCVLLLEALNVLCAAAAEGAGTMAALMALSTKASFLQRERAKERFLADEYAHAHRLLVAYFAQQPRAHTRYRRLWYAALLLLAINIALYVWRHSLPHDHWMSPAYRLAEEQRAQSHFFAAHGDTDTDADADTDTDTDAYTQPDADATATAAAVG